MPSRSIKPALGGISGVLVTPFNGEDRVDAGLLSRIAGRVAEAGVHALVAGGNTGEFYTLDGDEIRAVHDAAIAGNAGRSVLIAGVGRALKEAIALGRRAVEQGADAVMVHQPLDPFAAPQAQAAYFIAVAEAMPVPVLAYLRSNALGVTDIMAVANHPNVAGVKFATPNLMRLAECIRASGEWTAQWICGLAEGWAPAFYAQGARGFTSGLVNVDPGRSLAIHAALEAGRYEEARELVAAIAAFETMRTKFNNGANVTVVKSALRLMGQAVGPVRVPGLPELSREDVAELGEILQGWGIDLNAR
jgi:4-hydroxy-tetrahydrodipicolinate synthase